MTSVVELAGVSVVRGGSHLVDGIDWTVDEADRWVVIGPNGAGKTTLLQVLAAQIHPTTGVAGLLGDVLGTVDVFELRPRIGLTSAALADRLPKSERVADVVVSASYAVLGRWREEYDELDHERAASLLKDLGIGHLAERTFGTLSEGERKRVQIARALMTDPELMLLDEPAAGSTWPAASSWSGRCRVSRRPTARPRWCWSRTTSRRSRRASRMLCCSRRARSSRPARWTRR